MFYWLVLGVAEKHLKSTREDVYILMTTYSVGDYSLCCVENGPFTRFLSRLTCAFVAAIVKEMLTATK